MRPRPVFLGVQVSGLAWTVCPTRTLLLDMATILVHLHLSSRRRARWPLSSCSSRWPSQPATCSWRAAARKAPTQESPAWCVLQSRCVREASAGAGSPGTVRAESVRVRRGPCSLGPEPPPHPPDTRTLLTDGGRSPPHLPSTCLSHPLLLLRETPQLPGGVYWDGLRTLAYWDAEDEVTPSPNCV